MIRRTVLLALVVVAAAPAAAQSSAPIGRVERVVVWSYGTAPGAAVRDLHERQPVVANDVVETVPNGALHLRFVDETSFRLGPRSRAVLDRFAYDPAQGTGEMTIELGRGVFRFVSGTIPKDQVKVDTPTVTIGIRGTIYRLLQNSDGTGAVAVEKGPNGEDFVVTVKSKKSGEEIALHSGEKVEFGPDGSFGEVGGGTIEGCN